MHPTLRDTLEQSAEKYPEKDAIVYPEKDQRWTYAEFDRKANRLANALADLGVEHGDRVSTLLYNGSEIVLTVFACAKLGAVFNPLNFRLKSGEVEFILNDAGSSALVFEEATREAVDGARENLETVEEFLSIDEVPEYAHDFGRLLDEADPSRPDAVVADDDVYAFVYTSGTTGRPKGVVHEHRDMMEHNLVCIAEGGYRRDDVGLSALPLYHCAELQAALFPRIHLGATNVIVHEFEPDAVLSAIEEHGVSLLFAAPTAWNALARTAAAGDFDVSSLRLGLYGAAPMPADVLDACMEHLCDDYVQAYGMTEIGPCGTFQLPDEQRSKQGSAGLPALNHEVRLVEPDAAPDRTVEQGEVGEILFAGPCTMREYWNRPDATAESLREHDGKEWYYTGDLGYRDEDGYLYVVDRKDDMIVSGGENIYPTEVEDVLFSHPDVEEAAVVGEPHDEWGETVVAYVVTDERSSPGGAAASGESDVSAELLGAYCRDSETLADFKRPREYRFVSELPKNPSGKVQKFKLRDGEQAASGSADA